MNDEVKSEEVTPEPEKVVIKKNRAERRYAAKMSNKRFLAEYKRGLPQLQTLMHRQSNHQENLNRLKNANDKAEQDNDLDAMAALHAYIEEEERALAAAPHLPKFKSRKF